MRFWHLKGAFLCSVFVLVVITVPKSATSIVGGQSNHSLKAKVEFATWWEVGSSNCLPTWSCSPHLCRHQAADSMGLRRSRRTSDADCLQNHQ